MTQLEFGMIETVQGPAKPTATTEGNDPASPGMVNVAVTEAPPSKDAGRSTAIPGTPQPAAGAVESACSLIAAIRLDGLCGRPQAIASAGKALPLLLMLIHRCGNKTAIVCNFTDLATQLGVSTSTAKAWARELAMAGLITKKAAKASGIIITLADNVAGNAPLAQHIYETLTGAAEQLICANSVNTNALSKITIDICRLAELVES